MTVGDHPGLLATVQDNPGMSQSQGLFVRGGYPGLSGTFQHYQRLSEIIRDSPEQLVTVKDYQGLSETVPDCEEPGLSRTVND